MESTDIDNALNILGNWTKTKSPCTMANLTFVEMKSLEECQNISEHEQIVLFWSLVQVAIQNGLTSDNNEWKNALLECATKHQMDGRKLSELGNFTNIMKYNELNGLSALSISMIINMICYLSKNGVPNHMLQPTV